MPVAESFAPPSTIAEVLVRLDGAVESAVRADSPSAYFACLYRGVTRRVADDIEAGRFEDPGRMERLDVIFANRYLAALHAYERNAPTTASWRLAFDAARSGKLSILQHLLLGMNAHINLDLGIAAAQVAPGASLPALRRDFHEISLLLGEMLDDVQHRLGHVSPWLWLLDIVGGRSDEEICTFCLGGARDLAWRWAERFAVHPDPSACPDIDTLDQAVALLGAPIRRPTPLIGAALTLVRSRETNDVARVVAALR